MPTNNASERTHLLQDSLTPPVGSQIRIPSNTSDVISKFEFLNK